MTIEIKNVSAFMVAIGDQQRQIAEEVITRKITPRLDGIERETRATRQASKEAHEEIIARLERLENKVS